MPRKHKVSVAVPVPDKGELSLYYTARAPPTGLPSKTVQSYFPSLETLFPSLVRDPALASTATLAARELLVSMDASSGIVEDLITHERRTTPVWIRTIHLVEPVKVMSGDYVLPGDGALPASRNPWQHALHKLNNPLNEAYTDAVCACMMSRLVETKRSPHFVRFFGTFNGRVPEYNYNITDDMADIEGERWYAEGLQTGAVRIVALNPWNPEVFAPVTRPFEDVHRSLAAATSSSSSSSSSKSTASDDEHAHEDEHEDEHEDKPEDEHEGEHDSDLETVEDLQTIVDDIAMVSRPRIRLIRGESTGDEGSEESYTDDMEDIEFRAILSNFPVQMTILERCDGTLDELMETETHDAQKEARWTAWVFQIIAGLTTAQQTYEFVHNDLHTNNVMWCATDEPYLYYHITGAPGGDRYYRVPTFGRIMKLIDFGRATFRPPVAGQGVWLPDAFAPGGDAADQYNCGQYFNKESAKVSPNRSFDLCRLAVAMLETLWDLGCRPDDALPRKQLTREPGRTQNETVSPLWNLLWLWLTDREGRNVLRSPDGSERYPSFDLYVAIARDAENAVPAQQLTLPLFDGSFSVLKADVPVGNVWRLVGR